ncbi:unnamed protein product [Boreogadus saida]
MHTESVHHHQLPFLLKGYYSLSLLSSLHLLIQTLSHNLPFCPLSPFCPFLPLSVLSTSLSFSVFSTSLSLSPFLCLLHLIALSFSLSFPPLYRSLLFSVFSTSLSLSLSPSCHSQAVFCKSSLLLTSVRLSVGMGNASYIQAGNCPFRRQDAVSVHVG